jgi:hypothetical protein
VVIPRFATLGWFHFTHAKSQHFDRHTTRTKLRDDRFTEQRQLLRPRRTCDAHMQYTSVELRGHRSSRDARAYCRFPITRRNRSARIGRCAWWKHLVYATEHCAKLLDPPQSFPLLHCRLRIVRRRCWWYRRWESNPQAQRTADFESAAFAIPPLRLNSRARRLAHLGTGLQYPSALRRSLLCPGPNGPGPNVSPVLYGSRLSAPRSA